MCLATHLDPSVYLLELRHIKICISNQSRVVGKLRIIHQADLQRQLGRWKTMLLQRVSLLLFGTM